MVRKVSFFITALLLIPLFTSGQWSTEVQAATGCSGEVETARWNETVHRHAMVPDDPWFGGGMDDSVWMEDEEGDGSKGRSQDQTSTSADDLQRPEESWMYSPTWPLPALEPLTTGHYVPMVIGNDSVGALRFNLSSDYRTTFCVTLQSVEDGVSTPIQGDVYLLTTSQYRLYEEIYDIAHGSWSFWDGFGENELDALSDIPPEWRSFSPAGWQTYRDVHQYEMTSEVTFSVSMDGPELYSSLFGGTVWQDFYLVVDAWDNTHDGDALAPGANVVADVTVMPSERTLILPPWTVPLVFFGAMAALVATPFILNSRYLNAGLGDSNGEVAATVPLMEQRAMDGPVEDE
ncbi:MAG: hypothetical protein ISP83_02940 [Candidatus Poseidonia sp.]|nr:hypothetical protein [Poseidonia sp.]MBL6748313.1 hypothetical protein [Poseidonia sp.]MBL6806132.1 hypothetical protein [Poseidonia sp.]MBL6886146.1 hypothetical protein [Poseidonia sp.]MBL6892169.1 hypothetical protein [Poseidonia sp.]